MYFVVVGAFVVNKCIFYSFQISVYFNHFANKNNHEICCSKNIHWSRVECNHVANKNNNQEICCSKNIH